MLTNLALKLWPWIRWAFRKTPRCRRCAASEKLARLADGECILCKEYLPKQEKSASSFIVNEREAIMLVSGGKDSAFTAWAIQNQYPAMRVLNVIVDNGFMSPVAIPNAILLSDKLGVDLYICNSERHRFREKLSAAFQSLSGRGASGVIDFADGETIFQIGIEIAKRLNITTVFCGLSHAQSEDLNANEKVQDGVRLICPLAAWQTNQEDIFSTVQSLGLMHKASSSPLVSNSRLVPAMCALDYRNLGYSSFEPEITRMVREGKADAEMWRNIFEFTEVAARYGLLDRELDSVLSELGIKN